MTRRATLRTPGWLDALPILRIARPLFWPRFRACAADKERRLVDG